MSDDALRRLEKSLAEQNPEFARMLSVDHDTRAVPMHLFRDAERQVDEICVKLVACIKTLEDRVKTLEADVLMHEAKIANLQEKR